MALNSETNKSIYNAAASIPNEGTVQQVLYDFTEGWNRHDVKLFSAVFADDADFTNVQGISKSGRKAIEELHEPLFQTIWSQSILKITKSKIRFIKYDVAAVDAWWILDGLKTLDGKDQPQRNGLLSFVMVNENNSQWMIAVMHNMDLPGSQSQTC